METMNITYPRGCIEINSGILFEYCTWKIHVNFEKYPLQVEIRLS